jgi:hypothetical protein
MSSGKSADRQYWNPFVETLSRERLQELQLRKFKRIFEWAYRNSKFHRRLYQNAGIAPEDIRTLEDIRNVPKIEKAMVQEIQGKEPFPYGDALCVPLSEVVSRSTRPTRGRIGNGGRSAGAIFCMLMGIGIRTACLSPSVITSLSLFGPVTTRLKSSDAR